MHIRALGSVVLAAVMGLSISASGQEAKSQAKPPVPRLDGHPDLSGVWDHPFVIDMSQNSRRNNCGAALTGCSYQGLAASCP